MVDVKVAEDNVLWTNVALEELPEILEEKNILSSKSFITLKFLK